MRAALASLLFVLIGANVCQAQSSAQWHLLGAGGMGTGGLAIGNFGRSFAAPDDERLPTTDYR